MRNLNLQRCFFGILVLLFLASVLYQFSLTRSSRRVKLFVKDKQTGTLVTQRTLVPNTTSESERLLWILKELISGPTGNRYERILDPGIDVEKVIIKKNTAYVSFGWNLVDSLHDEPSLAIRAIVNSILVNMKSIKQVKILIEGIEPISTFCDISLLKTFEKPL
jgi:hypothetical protein